jgi:hypothetical protein
MATEMTRPVADWAGVNGLPNIILPPLTWETREQHLRAVRRWGDWPVMFYRTNLFIHHARVEDMVNCPEIVSPVMELYSDFNLRKARVCARYHDHHELIPKLGDICRRTKLMMNVEELSELQKREILAVEEISQIYAVRGRQRMVDGYPIRDILMHAVFKDCIEMQFVSAVDKMMDGYGEALHEALAGNGIFTEGVQNYLTKTWAELPEDCSLIAKVFSHPHNPFVMPPCDFHVLFDGGRRPPRPHTPEDVLRQTGIPIYEWWKRVTINRFGMDPLIHQTEFYDEAV